MYTRKKAQRGISLPTSTSDAMAFLGADENCLYLTKKYFILCQWVAKSKICPNVKMISNTVLLSKNAHLYFRKKFFSGFRLVKRTFD